MKKKIIQGSLLMIIILIVSIILINGFKIIRNETSAIVTNNSNASTTETFGGGKLLDGEIDPSSYNYNISSDDWNHGESGVWWEATDHDPSTYIAKYPGLQIYCINPGSPIRYGYEIGYQEAWEMIGDTYTAEHAEINGCAETPRKGERTLPVYKPVGVYDLPPAMAYIVSDEPIGEWDIEKQKAIWNTRDETVHDPTDDSYEEPADDDIIIGDATSGSSGPSKYDQEALDYAGYDHYIREKGIQLVNTTDINNYSTKVNQDTSEYTMGPFKMNYINGIYSNGDPEITDENATLAFSGISEIKVIGYDKDGNVVNEDIPIKRFLLKDEATGVYESVEELLYFEPSEDLKVDETEQLYPKPEQEFEVVFDDPNAGLSGDDDDKVAEIGVRVKFKYMLANGKYTKLRGTKYTVDYHHYPTYHCDHDCEDLGCEIDCEHDCEVSECCTHDCEDDGCDFDCDHECDDYCDEYGCDHDCEDDGCDYDCDHDCEDEGCCTHDCEEDDEGCIDERCGHFCDIDGCQLNCTHNCSTAGCTTNECSHVEHDDNCYNCSHSCSDDCQEILCDHIDSDGDGCNRNCGHNCEMVCYLRQTQQQWLMAADAIRSVYEEEFELRDSDYYRTTMDLGGHVWEDGIATKESMADGISNTSGDVDRPLKNVKVTLYTEEGVVVELLSNPNEAGISDEKLMHRVNPTYTDEEGNYLFEGLDAMEKYYVRFDYNGQTYLPTEYLNTANQQYTSINSMVNAGLYYTSYGTTDEWKYTSKGAELTNDREEFNNRFAEITAYPNNYPSTNSLGEVGNYNATFSQKDLMGYTLGEDGKYSQTQTQLIDGYLFDENGLETEEFKEGIISTKVREYIKQNKRYPSDSELKQIYSGIAGNDEETWRKLQFIEDIQIGAYSASPFDGDTVETYPVYQKFVINRNSDMPYEKASEYQNATYDMNKKTVEGVTYEPIYPGQFFVNIGLWRRQETDLAIRKDVYRAVLNINNKTAIYRYDKRNIEEDNGTNQADGNDNNTYWDINVRMSDYDKYYGIGYNRELYQEDYFYNSEDLNHPGEDLDILVTYKITVRNQSMSIMNQVTEVVDYYDKDYTYVENLSWVMYKDGNNNRVTFSESKYHEAMNKNDLSQIEGVRAINSHTTSKSGATSDVTNTYNAIYIRGLEDKKLATGESAYIYLTFRVNKDANERVILDDGTNGNTDTPKENIVEINGYKTYYKDNTELPNGIIKNSTDIAGLIDRDSNPGNLRQRDLQGEKYEKNFEDDTDRAISLRVKIYDAKRKISGVVWDDERTEKAGQAMIGDGIRDDSEARVSGVTVQLVEKTINGKEYIWYETKSNDEGYYEFEDYIPGEYIVRFYYGNNDATTKVEGYEGYNPGGENPISYNGQDYKSTRYQVGLSTDTLDQTETGTYRYDLYAADSGATNISDAKDLWEGTGMLDRIYRPNLSGAETKPIHGRLAVNAYSSGEQINTKAEILASPYSTPTYNGVSYTKEEMDNLIKQLSENTYMTAESGVMTIEFEYDRQTSDGLNTVSNNTENKVYLNGNDKNGTYHIQNLDLGLTERPKAQLEIDKSITGIKVTLANGSTLFDVKKEADNVIWQPHTIYDLAQYKNSDGIYPIKGSNMVTRATVDALINKHDNGLIQLTMDEELMHGAMIELSYTMKITNAGEYDYDSKEFYYEGTPTGNIVTTSANKVIDYVANNLQYDSENLVNKNRWELVNAETLLDSGYVNRHLEETISKYNAILLDKLINSDNEENVGLKPGESTENRTLVLSQLITTENSSDDLTYRNVTEIVNISNTVGRRMAFSITGNQDPTASKVSEIDSSIAERVIILPPFGERRIYYILGGVIGLILIGGITFIIRKVLKK